MTRKFIACKTKVYDRGIPPDTFLNEIIDWARNAPNEIFEESPNQDIYSNVNHELGPLNSTLQRKAVMLEVLRVLAGFESSWNWEEGVDTTNPDSNTPCSEEAGIFQCSGDSISYDSSLKTFVLQTISKTDCETFIKASKSNHTFAVEYCARLLRFTVNHHGPIKHHHIHKWLRRDAVSEFEHFLSE